jgi:hypothetical protein
MFKLDEGKYELVLTDSQFGSDVLPYARVKEYRPATGVVNSFEPFDSLPAGGPEMSVQTQNLPNLLEDIAERIGARARRRYRPLRPARAV